jgi:hypothetical protein
LTEIADARLTLTDPDTRRAYDAKLAAERPKPAVAAVAKPAAAPVRPKPIAVAAPVVAPPPVNVRPRRKQAAGGNNGAIVALIAVFCALGAVAGVAYVAWSRGNSPLADSKGSKTESAAKQADRPVDGPAPNTGAGDNPAQPPLDAPRNPPNNELPNVGPKEMPGLGPRMGPPDFGPTKKGGGPFGPGFFGPNFGPGQGGPGKLPPIPPGASGSMTHTETGPDGKTKTTTITFGPKGGAANDDPKTDLSQLRRDQRVEAKRGNSWINAVVKDLRADKVLVQFDGFADDFNEWVGPDRVRLPGAMASAGSAKKAPPRGAPSDVDGAIALLKDGGHFAVIDACKALNSMAVSTERQSEVVDALCDLIQSNKHAPREAYLTLAKWKNKKAVGVIAMKLAERPWTSGEAIKAAGMMKDKELVLPLIEMLTNFFQWDEASAALRQMGPVAELQVGNLLNHRDPKMRAEACRILAQIGTAKSLPKLRRAALDKNTKVEATAAIASVNAREEEKKEADSKEESEKE